MLMEKIEKFVHIAVCGIGTGVAAIECLEMAGMHVIDTPIHDAVLGCTCAFWVFITQGTKVWKR